MDREERLRLACLLLAKADSTEFPEEEAALLDKVEDLLEEIGEPREELLAELEPEPEPEYYEGVMYYCGRYRPYRVLAAERKKRTA